MLTEEKGRAVRRIFILEGEEVGGWWHVMEVVFELVNRPVNPDSREGKKSAGVVVAVVEVTRCPSVVV